MRMIRHVVVLATCCLATGCRPTKTFDLAVRNETDDFITLALTKDGPPFEPVWATPEDIAAHAPHATDGPGFKLVPPGRTAEAVVKGTFDKGTGAILRVYRGELEVQEMTKVSPTSPHRLDVPLTPGPNRFTV